MLTACLVSVLPVQLTAQIITSSGVESTPTGALRGEQLAPSVSLTTEGGLLVWEDNTIDGTNGTGIAARRLGADWTPASEVFRINELQAGDQGAPQAITLAGGNSLVSWQTRLGAKHRISARLLDSTGAFLTKDLQLNPETTNFWYRYRAIWQVYNRNRSRKRVYRLKDTVTQIRELSGHPVSAALPDGGAVVAYQSTRRAETNSWGLMHSWRWTGVRNLTNSVLVPTRVYVDWMQDVFFQRISATGQKVGPEVQVNQYADYNQRSPSVAVLADGSFVAAWVSEHPRSFIQNDNFRVDVYARLFSSQGEALGQEFQVNGEEERICANPVAAPLAGGGFVIAWSQQEAALSRRWDVVSRTFQANGLAPGSIETVNVTGAGDQFGPRIAAIGDHQFLIWTSVGQDGSREGVYGRLLYAGLPTGAEFRVNSTTISRQLQPVVAGDTQGRFLTLWSSYSGESGFDLVGQGYAVAPPAGGGMFDAQALWTAQAGETATGGNVTGVDPALQPAPTSAAPGSTATSMRLRVSGSGDKMRLHWNSAVGARYQVEASTDLKHWNVLGETRTAAGPTDSVGLDAGGSALFYRVIQLP